MSAMLFKNARIVNGQGFDGKDVCIVTDGAYIKFVGEEKNLPQTDKNYNEIIDCGHNLVVPAFCNAHGHPAMSVFRSYGEDMPLDKWLFEKIFPAEDKMDDDLAHTAVMLSLAEMIRNGTASFSDMYMFSEQTVLSAVGCGMKANVSRGISSFDPNENPAESHRVKETLALYEKYNGACDGRIIIDFSIHGEYTNTERMCRYMAELAGKYNTGLQIHLSETDGENADCFERHGMSPTAFFDRCGVFENRTAAAHCIWMSEDDLDIIERKSVFVIHNPVSNLKLGSGVMPLKKMLERNICVALGTDGASSNNTQSVLKELQYAALIHRGISNVADLFSASTFLPLATENGYKAQGREKCGKIVPGYHADLTMIDLHNSHNYPCHDPESALCYTAENSDVLMTVADGKILYYKGEYRTLDIERVMYDAGHDFDRFFSRF